MAEINKDNNVKTIAFYLPQFHTIPENDRWWGKGFTEWVNTKKAKPLFEGHYQPKNPLNNNFYDLSDVTVMERQAQLAKEYGLYGFCYYHYWFKDGKKLLEKPVENMLKDKKVDIPFCLSWANESWCRNWDGGNKEIIIKQEYGKKKEWEQHFKYLLGFFKDTRYITYEGKPLLLIYKPEQIPMLNKMVDYWQKRAKEEGFPGLVIVRQFPMSYYDETYDDSRINYTIKFEPETKEVNKHYAEHQTEMKSEATRIKRKIKNFLVGHGLSGLVNTLKSASQSSGKKADKLLVFDYDEAWDEILNNEPYNEKLINGAFVSWDNTPRNIKGKMYKGATPEKFEKYMCQLLEKESALNTVFINAWNEWAEGACLEPDDKYEYGWLKALQSALDSSK